MSLFRVFAHFLRAEFRVARLAEYRRRILPSGHTVRGGAYRTAHGRHKPSAFYGLNARSECRFPSIGVTKPRRALSTSCRCLRRKTAGVIRLPRDRRQRIPPKRIIGERQSRDV